MTARPLDILYLTKYAELGASSRYRFFQYFPDLEAAGIRCTAAPLLDDAYLSHRYAGGRGQIADYLRSLVRRLSALCSVRRYDLLFIEKELLPYSPALVEPLLSHLGVPYVAEYDDALFHQYDDSPSRLVRTLLGDKIARVMRHSRLVIAGNSYLAAYARRAGATRVEIVPTVVDLERYPLAGSPDHGSFTIGWIGSPTTSAFLAPVAEALAEVCRDGRGKVVLIGAGSLRLSGVPCETLPWSYQNEVAQLSSLDVGIMPLPDTPWARGKCGLKLIQYMACGMPVVASPVGANEEIVEPGRNGFLAGDTRQWIRALTSLRDDRQLRLRLGQAGRDKVEKSYCRQVTAPRLVQLIREAAGDRP